MHGQHLGPCGKAERNSVESYPGSLNGTYLDEEGRGK